METLKYLSIGKTVAVACKANLLHGSEWVDNEPRNNLRYIIQSISPHGSCKLRNISSGSIVGYVPVASCN